jgi:hypothetical protein
MTTSTQQADSPPETPSPRLLLAPHHYAVACVLITVVAALMLWWLGRVPISKSGYVKLWHGQVMSSENSQHLLDWYSPSHVIHGFGFYLMLWLVAARQPVGLRLVLATLIEAAWEVFENTDFVINRYRETTIALDYYGDSIVNSVADIGMAVAGFLLAARAPVWTIIAITVAFELTVGYFIRDNLTLNVVMLLYPSDAVREWQMRAGP